MPTERLSRALLASHGIGTGELRPVRLVHIGLGAFHRAHQAWWTDAVDTGGEWGIAAFSGRSPRLAEQLDAQGGLFTLVARSNDGDSARVVQSISRAYDGSDLTALAGHVATPETSLVTLTITEAGYRLLPGGRGLDLADSVVQRDLEWLSRNLGHGPFDTSPSSSLARLLVALDARRRATGLPIAIVPCDNMPNNGASARSGLLELASRVNGPLHDWIAESVSFVSTSVDRITPRLADVDRDIASRLTWWADACPVVTEQFRDWVLTGDFPIGRPAWEHAGARFVDEIAPFEHRKLWLLNGAHSLLAYLGQLRGHHTVADAIADRVCQREVIRFWGEARRGLPADGLDLDAYCDALLERFGNTRIRHELTQIGTDGVTKLRLRVLPVAIRELQAGGDAEGCATVLASWMALVLADLYGPDSESAAVTAALGRTETETVRALVRLIGAELADEQRFVRTVLQALTRVRALSATSPAMR